MNLIIDIGNSFTKLALFQFGNIVCLQKVADFDIDFVKTFCEKKTGISHVIISAVKDYSDEIDIFFKQKYGFFLFTHRLPIPITHTYVTPESLGKDRLAAAIGANAMFPNRNTLAIDFGTAIKFDFVNNKNEYLGGSISPGVNMRYKALHAFTGRLPLLNYMGNAQLTGVDTNSCIQSGVLNGALAEVEGIIDKYKQTYTDLQIILTGGDYNYFDKRLKIKTFVAPNLVLEGLNLILNYNIEKY